MMGSFAPLLKNPMKGVAGPRLRPSEIAALGSTRSRSTCRHGRRRPRPGRPRRCADRIET